MNWSTSQSSNLIVFGSSPSILCIHLVLSSFKGHFRLCISLLLHILIQWHQLTLELLKEELTS